MTDIYETDAEWMQAWADWANGDCEDRSRFSATYYARLDRLRRSILEGDYPKRDADDIRIFEQLATAACTRDLTDEELDVMKAVTGTWSDVKYWRMYGMMMGWEIDDYRKGQGT